jgi:hypothetical protein
VEAAFVHRIEDAAVDRFQAVTHVRQRAAHDHAHRVIEIGPLHFLENGDRFDAIIAASLVLFAFLVIADRIDRFLGDTGRTILTRLLGVVLAALSVQFVVDGIKQAFVTV